METRHHLEYASAAERDIKKLDGTTRKQIRKGLVRLVAIPPPGNLDVVPVTGHAPFMRMRVGDFRVLYRPLSEGEMQILRLRRGTLDGVTGFLVARVVNRKDLERAVAALQHLEIN